MVRVILAALFVLACLFGVSVLFTSAHAHRMSAWWGVPLMTIALLGSTFLALSLFNRRGYRPHLSGASIEEQVRRLEEQGLLRSETFTVQRAFAVEEFEDEGPSYYLELQDGAVLFLSGQYLYDYEPLEPDPGEREEAQPRKFPCTSFTVRRHQEEDYVIDLQCAGTVLEPEVTAPPFTKEDWKVGVPEDGQIIRDTPYERLKATRMKGQT